MAVQTRLDAETGELECGWFMWLGTRQHKPNNKIFHPPSFTHSPLPLPPAPMTLPALQPDAVSSTDDLRD